MPDFIEFQNALGIRFTDLSLLTKAFTHRSYINENRSVTTGHNERLEFLGDAVLELVVTEFLYAKYPHETEGALTAYRAGLVNTSTLATVATGIGMGNYLLLSKGEAKDTGRARQYILANTFEAFVGALYLDQGYRAAEAFIRKYLFPLTDEIVGQKLWQDAKSRFQELSQEKVSVTPTYELLSAIGPDHDRQFTVGVYLKEDEIARGVGKSKQEAEQDAARNALSAKGWQ